MTHVDRPSGTVYYEFVMQTQFLSVLFGATLISVVCAYILVHEQRREHIGSHTAGQVCG